MLLQAVMAESDASLCRSPQGRTRSEDEVPTGAETERRGGVKGGFVF